MQPLGSTNIDLWSEDNLVVGFPGAQLSSGWRRAHGTCLERPFSFPCIRNRKYPSGEARIISQQLPNFQLLCLRWQQLLCQDSIRPCHCQHISSTLGPYRLVATCWPHATLLCGQPASQGMSCPPGSQQSLLEVLSCPCSQLLWKDLQICGHEDCFQVSVR